MMKEYQHRFFNCKNEYWFRTKSDEDYSNRSAFVAVAKRYFVDDIYTIYGVNTGNEFVEFLINYLAKIDGVNDIVLLDDGELIIIGQSAMLSSLYSIKSLNMRFQYKADTESIRNLVNVIKNYID